MTTVKTLCMATAIACLSAPGWAAAATQSLSLQQACGLAAASGADIGNPDRACNPDLDGNGRVGPADLAMMKRSFFASDARADLNADGVVNFQDLGLLKAFYGYSPAAFAAGWRPALNFIEGGGGCPSIVLAPTPNTVGPGDMLTLTISMDFTCDATLGGGMDVMWDGALLSLVSWDPIPFGDPGFATVGTIGADNIDGFSFGDFNGLSGPADVATITLQANNPGTSQVTMDDDSDGAAGPFVSATTFVVQTVDFQPADVDIVAPSIPLGGTIVGTNTALAGCRNTTLSQTVFAPQPAAPPPFETFDCEAMGLVVNAGNAVIVYARGNVVGASGQVSGTFTRVAPGAVVRCQNVTQMQTLNVPMNPDGTFSCTGLVVAPGNLVVTMAIGSAL